MGLNISYLASFFFFFMVLRKISIRWLKKNRLQIYLSSIKIKVAVKLPKKNFFFFFPAFNRLGIERLKCLTCDYQEENLEQFPLHCETYSHFRKGFSF